MNDVMQDAMMNDEKSCVHVIIWRCYRLRSMALVYALMRVLEEEIVYFNRRVASCVSLILVIFWTSNTRY